MVLINDIILLVPNMALIEAHSSSTHLPHVVHSDRYMIVFSMAVIVDGEEWLGLVGGGGGYL